VTHHRQVIRAAVAAALAAGATAAGTRVYQHPWDPRVTLPALVVEDDGEQQQSAAIYSGTRRPIERVLLLTVSAELKQSDDYAQARDALVADVERILATAALPGVKSVVPAGYEPEISGSGDKPIVVGRQRFQITYFTSQDDPSVAL
jgi:hypothetical protein